MLQDPYGPWLREWWSYGLCAQSCRTGEVLEAAAFALLTLTSLLIASGAQGVWLTKGTSGDLSEHFQWYDSELCGCDWLHFLKWGGMVVKQDPEKQKFNAWVRAVRCLLLALPASPVLCPEVMCRKRWWKKDRSSCPHTWGFFCLFFWGNLCIIVPWAFFQRSPHVHLRTDMLLFLKN